MHDDKERRINNDEEKKRPSTYTVSSLSDGLLNLLVFGGNGIVGVHILIIIILGLNLLAKGQTAIPSKNLKRSDFIKAKTGEHFEFP